MTMTFGDDAAFIGGYMKPIVLSDSRGVAKVAVLAELQGRVMTSTADGDDGMSFGWINRELFELGEKQEHINPYGGEDRFWMGPEGGQFSIFFKEGGPFDLEHWFTPPEIDTIPFDLVEQDSDRALFKKDMTLTNCSGTVLELLVDREIKVLESDDIGTRLGVALPDSVKSVCYESINKITNTGNDAWRKETGLLSIWILGMYNPSPETKVIIPFVAGAEDTLGPVVNDAYFGKVPADKLLVKDDVMFFSGDGTNRSKIGVTPQRAKPVLGSYDPGAGVLTVVQYTKPEGAIDYINSMWEVQDEPYRGDVVNSYNDGPPEPGAKPLGPFYEIETSSPAVALKPGESLEHTSRTFHIQGSESDLDPISRAVLGVGLDEVKGAL